MSAGAVSFGAETATAQNVLKNITVVTGWLALPQSEDVGKANQHRPKGREKGHKEGRIKNDEQNKKHSDARSDAANQPPEKVAFQPPSPAFRVGRRVGVRQPQFISCVHA
jgi:hypothetical protein